MIEGGGAIKKPSQWPRNLLIIGVVLLIIGLIGLFSTVSKIDETLRPDHLNKAVIESGESTTQNITALRIYSLFQNVTNSGEIYGTITIISEGKEVEFREPSLMSGVGVMEFDDGVIFEPMGWIQLSENSIVEFTSESNQTIYLVDQNEVSSKAFTNPIILASCFSLLFGGCLLPVGLILFLVRRKEDKQKSNVTLRTSDGREVSLSVDSSTSSGAVLTTDQIYALARLQEKAGPDGKITLDFKMVDSPTKMNTPPPFADRPDTVDEIKIVEDNTSIDISDEQLKSGKSEEKDTKSSESNWKSWDEG
ncbi:MAG: hypothetical protein CMA77_05370 [Euryarchaeota archaeon]|nr:hypothetical protein [Euryarchaeota archaeon]|tara:strand:- start:1148 stop:2068 length:921 start_codon:yes stop_codon:yes gene_type:complete